MWTTKIRLGKNSVFSKKKNTRMQHLPFSLCWFSGEFCFAQIDKMNSRGRLQLPKKDARENWKLHKIIWGFEKNMFNAFPCQEEKEREGNRGSGDLWLFGLFESSFWNHFATLGLLVLHLLLFIYHLLSIYLLAINPSRISHFCIICVSFLAANFRKITVPTQGARCRCESKGFLPHPREFLSWCSFSQPLALPKF